MYKIGQEIDFKKIKIEQSIERFAYGFLASFSIVITILLEM